MQIELTSIGKRYNRNWIFRNINFVFEKGKSYALLGSNGSGKSTLLQTISGYQTATEGTVFYHFDSHIEKPEKFYLHQTLATPYLGLPEELTVEEMLQFHGRFKKNLIPYKEMLELMWLEKDRFKEIRQLSSGMRQRLRLVLALCYASEVIFLDEPASHLDRKGFDWYRKLIEVYQQNRTLIIASNQPEEYDFCNEVIEVEGFKPKPKISRRAKV